jgi:signal transduction histidine kinase
MRPLDRFTSIKTKIGVVIVVAVGVTIAVVVLGVKAGVPLLLCGLAAGVLALGMVQLLARGMTSPLREMASAASSMATGEYGRRVTSTSNDEVGELARAFNSMAADLEEVDRVRRDLVANVSHELRTPITALQAILENLVDGIEEPDIPTLDAMLNQIERLGRLVDQLLDLSRLESGVVPLEATTFPARALLDEVVRETRLHYVAPNRLPSLEVSVTPTGLQVVGDRERIHQVVGNLVDNALRHSPPNEAVTLAACRQERKVRIEVRDRGPGIPEDEVERVFERFYRSDRARTSSDGGTGLGLAIARWVVDLHGGSIWAERNDPGGCRMVVLLPGE